MHLKTPNPDSMVIRYDPVAFHKELKKQYQTEALFERGERKRK